MDKTILRKEMIIKRNIVSDKKVKSLFICNKIQQESWFKKANVVAFYLALSSEVDLTELLNIAFKEHKSVCVPKVECEKMNFYIINSFNDLEIGNFNILEPQTANKNVVNPKDIEVFLIPGVCFDTFGNRIGYGRGYYDKYLKLNKNAIKVGVAFKEQVMESIEKYISNDDVKLDVIISD